MENSLEEISALLPLQASPLSQLSLCAPQGMLLDAFALVSAVLRASAPLSWPKLSLTSLGFNTLSPRLVDPTVHFCVDAPKSPSPLLLCLPQTASVWLTSLPSIRPGQTLDFRCLQVLWRQRLLVQARVPQVEIWPQY